jgi:hypothetical protein
LLEAPRNVSVKAPAEMGQRLRNSVLQIDRFGIVLRVAVPARDGFALAREKADPVLYFGEAVYQLLRILAIMLRG